MRTYLLSPKYLFKLIDYMGARASRRQIKSLREKHLEDIKELRREHDLVVQKIEAKHLIEMVDKDTAVEERLETIKKEHRNNFKKLDNSYFISNRDSNADRKQIDKGLHYILDYEKALAEYEGETKARHQALLDRVGVLIKDINTIVGEDAEAARDINKLSQETRKKLDHSTALVRKRS